MNVPKAEEYFRKAEAALEAARALQAEHPEEMPAAARTQFKRATESAHILLIFASVAAGIAHAETAQKQLKLDQGTITESRRGW